MNSLLRLPILCRPLNCLITFLSVWVGAIVAGKTIVSSRILIAALSAALITAYGNIINDLFDLKVDMLSKPNRPLVRGIVGRGAAIALAIILALIGFGLSLAVAPHAWVVALAVIALLLAYTPVFKGMIYLGNILVAGVASLAFVYGGMAVGRPLGAAILVAFAFLLHLGREIVKDIQDRAADAAVGHRTGATIADGMLSRVLGSLVLVVLIAATWAPFFAHAYGIGYLIVVVIGVDFIVVESIHALTVSSDADVMQRVSLWLKIAMPVGLAAVLIGKMGL